MGTRNLTCVYYKGQYPIAQYGQWDGYPSGQGLTILRFLRKAFDRELFISKLPNALNLNEEQTKQLYVECGHDFERDGEWLKDETSRRFKAANPLMSRDIGGNILQYIQESTRPHPTCHNLGFAGDSLMCEWVYVVDLDSNTLEVYRGFNTEPLAEGERFAFLETDNSFAGGKYKQVRFACMFSLDDLPSDEEFLKVAEPRDEDECEDDE